MQMKPTWKSNSSSLLFDAPYSAIKGTIFSKLQSRISALSLNTVDKSLSDALSAQQLGLHWTKFRCWQDNLSFWVTPQANWTEKWKIPKCARRTTLLTAVRSVTWWLTHLKIELKVIRFKWASGIAISRLRENWIGIVAFSVKTAILMCYIFRISQFF